MNHQIAQSIIIEGQGKSTLSTSPVVVKGRNYHGPWEVTLEIGATFRIHRGGFSVTTEEIVGFASPKVWMTRSGDPDPENWAQAMKEMPTVITKTANGIEDYQIRKADDVAGQMRTNEQGSDKVTPLG